MKNLKHARKGQMVTSEYVLLFFVAVASISAMTLYVQRGLQSRSRDAKIHMVDLAAAACTQATTGGVDCMGAAGVNMALSTKFAYEYEPYYAASQSRLRNDGADKKTLDEDSTWGKDFATFTKVDGRSEQRPPKYGDMRVVYTDD